MQQFTYAIRDPDGIHARPAGLLVKKLQEFKSEVAVAKGDKKADGKKLFQVMRLGVKCNDEILVTVTGEDEVEAAAAAKATLEENL